MDLGITNNVQPALSLGGLGGTPQPPIQEQQSPPYQPPMQQQSPPPYQAPPQQQRPASTGVSLQKGQKVSLTKMNASLDNILVGLGWDINQTTSVPHDLDVEVFMLNANDRIVGDDWFVFYNQLVSPDGSVRHSGDNKTGAGAGDDEVINIQLSRVNAQAQKLVFIVTINDAQQRGHNFGQMQNAYIRVVDSSSNKELVRFNLTDYYTNVVSMLVAELYKHNNEWKFNPVGEGLMDDLLGLCRRYGVNAS